MLPARTLLRQAAACLLACSVCAAARAADWLAQPSVWWYLDYDTNRRLAPEGQGETPDDAGYMTLDLLLSRATETGELDIHPQLELQRFTRDTALDADSGSLQLSASHHEELWSVGSNVGYAQESTLITELASTGIIDASSRQDALTADVNATRKLSALQSFTADVSYSDISYPGGLPAGLVGYEYYSGSLSYAYSYSQRSTFSLVAFGGDMQNEQDLHLTDVGARLQWVYAVTSLLTMTASAGAGRADLQGSANSGPVWSFSLVRRAEREGKWSFSVERDVEPDGRGLLINHEEADLSLTRGVAPHLFLIVKATAIRDSDVFVGITFDDRRYYAGDLGLECHPVRDWQVSFTGGYSQSTEPDEPSQYAHGWRAAVTLRWTPLPWSVSR
jgi:hypothetical protein